METKERIFTGTNDGYHWLVTSLDFPELPQIAVRHHLGLHLCITAYDSGPLRPSDDEVALGWFLQGEVMVSPPLTASLDIPCEQYDEWYILREPAFEGRSIEVFVKYVGFTLVPPETLANGRDPTWERNAFDFLEPIQERFWSQLRTLGAETYVATGDNTVVVSRSRDFVDRLRATADGYARV